jgi:hypothetical protein
MRLSVLIAALAVAAPIGFCAGSASAQIFEGQSVLFGRPHGSAYEGAWCGNADTGGGRVEEDCHFDSFEACRRAVISGNRGTCTQNPAYAGFDEREYYRKKKKRRARQ